MIKAISGPHDGEYYIVTDGGVQGVFSSSGERIRGEDIGETRDEIAYRIWAQKQNPKIKQPQLRQMWKELNVTHT